MSSNVEKSGAPEVQGHDTPVEHAYVDEKTRDANLKQDAIEAENLEHNMGVLQALRDYPMAALWAFIMSCTIIMESYCVFLMGNFVALPAFKEHFGILSPNGEYALTAEWQSALQMGGPIGAIIGVVLAGPLTSWIGYRWATIIALMFLNAFIFIIYFGNSLPVFLVSQLTAGIPWGIFIANSPAYCSEIVPIPLRAPATQMLQMFWAFGSIIVTGVSYTYAEDHTPAAYRVPSALQWMFPTPLAILMFLAPESPWWLVRKGRLEEAARSISRLGSKLTPEKVNDSVAMMRRTVELEANNKEPNLVELWKGTDRYRTLIVCGVYAAQNLTGNLIANQAVVFFQSAGMGDQLAFALGLITSGLQVVMVMLSWILTTYLGRRTIYVWGSAFNVVLLVALGIAASIGDPKARTQALAQASLGLIVSVLFTLGPAPASWVIIGETSSIRLRPLTTGIGRGCYYIVNIPCIYLSAWMLSVNGANLGAKCGYVWGGTGLFCTIMAYFFLPEMQHRSYREIDILFKRHVNARKWPETLVDAQDDE